MAVTLIDLSHILESGMPVFPGSGPVVLQRESTLDKDNFNETRLSITTHTGTHIDCEYHLLAGGNDILSKPAENFYGPGVAIDFRKITADGIITMEHLMQYGKDIRSADFVLLVTGWSRYWGTPSYFTGFPVMNEEAASYLTSFHLKGTGCDTVSFDPVESESLRVHHILLSSGMILIENLVNLENLPRRDFIFSCLPLRIKDGDGSPVRAVGIVE